MTTKKKNNEELAKEESKEQSTTTGLRGNDETVEQGSGGTTKKNPMHTATPSNIAGGITPEEQKTVDGLAAPEYKRKQAAKASEHSEEEKALLKNLGMFNDEPQKLHAVKKQRRTRKTKEPEQVETKLPVSGKFLIKVTDRVMNTGIVAVDRMVYKDKSTIKIADLKIEDSEIDTELIQLAEEALKAMKLSANPIEAFIGGMALLTLSKYFAIKM